MIIRIVKMGFEPEKVSDFLAIFDASCEKIRAFPGCQYLELLRDESHPHRFFTYSWWKEASDLENYRRSELFRNTWAATKVLFSEKPEAWSLHSAKRLK